MELLFCQGNKNSKIALFIFTYLKVPELDEEDESDYYDEKFKVGRVNFKKLNTFTDEEIMSDPR